MVLNKKTVDRLGTYMNDAVASKPSSFALKQMEKMGWKEGKGLGKNEDGMSKHIVISKREEGAALGSEKLDINETADNWWHDAFAQNLMAFSTGAKKTKKRKDKSEARNADVDALTRVPSYEELFKATGGARLGMRARADQKGKFRRTESTSSFSNSTISTNQD